MSRSSAPSSCHHRWSPAQRVSPHLPLPVPDLSRTVLDTATGLTNFHFPFAINRVSLGFSSFIISKQNFWVLPAKAGEPLSLFLAPNWPQTQLEFNPFSCLFFFHFKLNKTNEGVNTTFFFYLSLTWTSPSSTGIIPELPCCIWMDTRLLEPCHGRWRAGTSDALGTLDQSWHQGTASSPAASSNVTAAISFPKFLVILFRLYPCTLLHPSSPSHQAAQTLF